MAGCFGGTAAFAELYAFVDGVLGREAFRGGDDPNRIWRNTTRPVAAVGLLLEGDGETAGWVAREGLDALIVHRPRSLPTALPGEPGVLAYHAALDERLAIGMNRRLADALGLTRLEVLGEKEGRPLGMVGDVSPVSLGRFAAQLVEQFGDVTLLPEASDWDGVVRRVAVVGAMRPALVTEAVQRGADLYLTGDVRIGALPAVESAGIVAAGVGKDAGERWALRALAVQLREGLEGVRFVMGPT